MPRKPDTLCAGGCGKRMFKGSGSLTPGVATCQPCRRARKMVDCLVCSKPFASNGRTRACSPHCGGVLAVGARLGGPVNQRSGRTCEVCGTTYRATYADQRTCGRACGAKIQRPRARADRRTVWPACRVWIMPCAVCLELTTFRTRRQIWTCSTSCRDREYNRRRRPGAIERTGICPCGTPLPDGRQRCDPCIRETLRSTRRRRKARKRGAASEPYTLTYIAKRDHNRCGLCGKRVAMAELVPHPNAPTIDHVVPLACGGDDTRANVQLAHFICNSTKSANGSQQLALVG